MAVNSAFIIVSYCFVTDVGSAAERNVTPLGMDLSCPMLRMKLILDSGGVVYQSPTASHLPFDELNPPVLVPASIANI